LVYRVVGEGTKWLSERSSGEVINVLGPLGKGFTAPLEPGKVLIVGGGVGTPPLYQLANELARQGFKLDIVLGFKNQGDVFWTREFAEFGDVTVCTEDGSVGEKGFVTEVIDVNKNWTTLYSCGPKPMLKALKAHFEGRDIPGYVSLEERMACGVGACWGCTCLDPNGTVAQRICKEGPVFPWEEVSL
jgi:dihydroorotate dehydrogenase electron transfer subunit